MPPGSGREELYSSGPRANANISHCSRIATDPHLETMSTLIRLFWTLWLCHRARQGERNEGIPSRPRVLKSTPTRRTNLIEPVGTGTPTECHHGVNIEPWQFYTCLTQQIVKFPKLSRGDTVTLAHISPQTTESRMKWVPVRSESVKVAAVGGNAVTRTPPPNSNPASDFPIRRLRVNGDWHHTPNSNSGSVFSHPFENVQKTVLSNPACPRPKIPLGHHDEG